MSEYQVELSFKIFLGERRRSRQTTEFFRYPVEK